MARFIPLNLDECVAHYMLKEQRWKEIGASHREVQFGQNFLPSRSPPEPPNSTPHAGAVGRSQLKLQGVKLSSSNQRKLEEVSVKFQFSNSNLEDKSD